MPSSYALGEHFEKFMDQLIQEGRYNSKSEILRDGLRVIEDRERERAVKFEALKAAVLEGVNSGPGIPSEEVREHLLNRYKS
jgi:antitoxin ParD1/3/4